MGPDFLIIGAEKAGTTWLHSLLSQHPETQLPEVKELHFFNRFDSNLRPLRNFEQKGLDWYRGQFTRGAVSGEATPLYLSDPEAPARISTVLPNVRAIALLRDPVDRALSHFRMARAKGHVTGDFLDQILRVEPRILGRGLYGAQLREWFALFPAAQIKVVYFEQLNRPETLAEIAAFLGIAAEPLLAASGHQNAASEYRSATVYYMSVRTARALRNQPLTRGMARRLKASGLYDVIKRANRVPAAPEPLAPEAAKRLVAFYQRDVARLTRLLGRTPPWDRFAAKARADAPAPC